MRATGCPRREPVRRAARQRSPPRWDVTQCRKCGVGGGATAGARRTHADRAGWRRRCMTSALEGYGSELGSMSTSLRVSAHSPKIFFRPEVFVLLTEECPLERRSTWRASS